SVMLMLLHSRYPETESPPTFATNLNDSKTINTPLKETSGNRYSRHSILVKALPVILYSGSHIVLKRRKTEREQTGV
ncbi:hypothetical protein, partial [Escherichia coli]|uniref:hypothetical protein n=1 Tax=Escherichia coli TaxID=562 RepID=UPI0020C12562